MILSVKLKNWKSHLDSEFVFKKGTNAIIGISGAGKSSVTDAISFALFGTFPDLQQKKLKLDDVIMNKSFSMNEAEVEVEFVCNGKLFKVKRRVEKGKGTNLSEIHQKQKEKPWKLLESPKTSAVTECVESILEIDYDLFSRAIYSNQNRLDFFLEVKPGKRKELIDELLGINKYEIARANMVKVVNIASVKIKDWESTLQKSNLEELKKKKISLEKITKKCIDEKNILEKNIVENEIEVEKAKQVLTKYCKKEEMFNALNQKKAVCISSIDSLNVQLNEKNSVVKQHGEYVKLIEPEKKLFEINKLLVQIKKTELQLEPILKEKNSLEVKLSSVDEEITSLMVELKKSIGDTKPSEVQEKLKLIEKNLVGFEKQEKNLEEKIKTNYGKKVGFESELNSGKDEYNLIVLKIQEIIEKEELFKTKTSGKSIEDIYIEKNNLEKEYLLFEKKYSLLETDSKDKKEAIIGLEKSNSKCPLCESEMSVERRQSLIEKNKSTIALNKISMDKIQKEMAVIFEKIKLFTVFTEEAIKLSTFVAGKKEFIEKKHGFEKKFVELKKDLNKIELEAKLNESIRLEVAKNIKNLRVEKELLLNSSSIITRLCVVKSNAVNWKKELETVEKKLKEINSEVNISKKESLEIEYKNIEAVCEVNKIEEKIKTFDKELIETKKQIELLSFVAFKLEKFRQTVSDLMSDISVKKERSKGFLREIESQESHLKDVKEQIKAVEELFLKVNVLKTKLDNFRIFTLALIDTQDILRKNFIEEINLFMDDVWPRIYFYKDYSSIRLDVENGNYVLQVKNRTSQWISVEGKVSGGERSVACLALRIAFSFVLTGNLSWLILDEPTHNLDSQGIELLADALRDYLPSIVDQIFLITHEQAMEKAVSGSFYCLERNKDEDGVTKVNSE